MNSLKQPISGYKGPDSGAARGRYKRGLLLLDGGLRVNSIGFEWVQRREYTQCVMRETHTPTISAVFYRENIPHFT